MADNLEPDVAARFLSYPIPKTIIEALDKLTSYRSKFRTIL